MLCMNERGDVNGWKDLGPTTNSAWHQYLPAHMVQQEGDAAEEKREYTAEEKKAWSARQQEIRAEKKAKEQREERDRRSALTPVARRDEEARKKGGYLTPEHKESLRARRWSQEWIDYAIENCWFYSTEMWGASGFLIRAHNIKGQICGAQFARDDRAPKYQWVSHNRSVHLPETGDNPLFIWTHPSFDPTHESTIGILEGALKTATFAVQYWDQTQDTQRRFVGGGSIPKPETVIDFLSSAKPSTAYFYPDAGVKDAKPNVLAYAKAMFTATRKLDIKTYVVWSNQWDKATSVDADEWTGSERVRLISVKAFLALQPWKRSQNYSADVVKTGEFVEFADLVDENTSIFVKAGLGTGKTEELISLLKKSGRGAVIISPSDLLKRDVEGRLRRGEFTNVYVVRKGEDLSKALEDPSSIIVLCLDSMHHIPTEAYRGRVLAIDEAQSNWRNYLQRQTAIKRNRREILGRLNDAIETSWANIFLDANLTDQACEFYSSPNRKELKLSHLPIKPKRLKILFLSTKDNTEVLALIHDALVEQEATIVVFCDSLIQLKALRERYQKEYKTRMICSELDGEEWRKEAIHTAEELTNEQDINAFLEKDKPRLLLLSPSVLTGFNIAIRKYFDHGFLIATGVLACDDLEQFLFRLRDEEVARTIWVKETGLAPKNGGLSEDTVDEISAALIEYAKADYEYAGLEAGKGKDLTELWEQLKLQAPLLLRAKLERENLREMFLQKLIDAGHDVEIVSELECSDRAKKEQKAVEFEQKIRWAAEVLNAEELSEAQYRGLEEKEHLTAKERAQKDRFLLVQHLHGIEYSHEWTDTTEDPDKKVPKNLLFVNELLQGDTIKRATAHVLYNLEGGGAQALHKKRWEKTLEQGYIEKIGCSIHLFNSAVKECGLDVLLRMDKLSNQTPEVVQFLHSCRKNKNLKGLSELKNKAKALSNILRKLGYRKEELSRVGNERFSRIVCALPPSVVVATERRIHAQLQHIGPQKDILDLILESRQHKIVWQNPAANDGENEQKIACENETVETLKPLQEAGGRSARGGGNLYIKPESSGGRICSENKQVFSEAEQSEVRCSDVGAKPNGVERSGAGIFSTGLVKEPLPSAPTLEKPQEPSSAAEKTKSTSTSTWVAQKPEQRSQMTTAEFFRSLQPIA